MSEIAAYSLVLIDAFESDARPCLFERTNEELLQFEEQITRKRKMDRKKVQQAEKSNKDSPPTLLSQTVCTSLSCESQILDSVPTLHYPQTVYIHASYTIQTVFMDL